MHTIMRTHMSSTAVVVATHVDPHTGTHTSLRSHMALGVGVVRRIVIRLCLVPTRVRNRVWVLVPLAVLTWTII